MFQRDKNSPLLVVKNMKKIKSVNFFFFSLFFSSINSFNNFKITFCPPIIIASCVENIWAISNIECDNLYMKLSLWLSCGSNGIKVCIFSSPSFVTSNLLFMKVWLPLSHKEDLVRFQSHRIMLSFPLTIYPLAILINEALILGISNEFSLFENKIYYQVLKTVKLKLFFCLFKIKVSFF
jgi:hypothetical protein